MYVSNCSLITTTLFIPHITIALADSAAAMKNMTPEDMGKLISEMEGMPEAQKAQLKGMGMDPDTSKKVVCLIHLYNINILPIFSIHNENTVLTSMKMMKENPQMMKTAQKLMENMTPEQMLEQSKAAQEKMSR